MKAQQIILESGSIYIHTRLLDKKAPEDQYVGLKITWKEYIKEIKTG